MVLWVKETGRHEGEGDLHEERDGEGLRYSSHTARSGLGLARVARLFVWPRHVKLAC